MYGNSVLIAPSAARALRDASPPHRMRRGAARRAGGARPRAAASHRAPWSI
jgi:hypothetical protein